MTFTTYYLVFTRISINNAPGNFFVDSKLLAESTCLLWKFSRNLMKWSAIELWKLEQSIMQSIMFFFWHTTYHFFMLIPTYNILKVNFTRSRLKITKWMVYYQMIAQVYKKMFKNVVSFWHTFQLGLFASFIN